jgi:hypothetical protein
MACGGINYEGEPSNMVTSSTFTDLPVSLSSFKLFPCAWAMCIEFCSAAGHFADYAERQRLSLDDVVWFIVSIWSFKVT